MSVEVERVFVVVVVVHDRQVVIVLRVVVGRVQFTEDIEFVYCRRGIVVRVVGGARGNAMDKGGFLLVVVLAGGVKLLVGVRSR